MLLSLLSGRTFGPANVSDLEIWLDATDTGTVIRDGSDKVSRWNDKSGNRNDATQGTGANQPTFNPTGLNNKPTLCFDFPTSDFMLVPNGANGSSEYDVFVVAEVNNTVDTMHMLSARPLIDNVDTFTFNRPSSNHFRALFNATANLANYTDLTTTVGAPFIAETAFGSTVTDMAGFKDGILSSFTDTASGVMNVTPLGVGCLYNTVAMTPQDLWDGNISEILVYSRSLTTSERAVINQYLSNKYGIAVTAPDNIADLELWLDGADRGTILEEDTVGKVSRWNDKSGNGNDATQGTGSAQPITNATTINGRNVLDFDGGDYLSKVLSVDITTTTLSAFVVASRAGPIASTSTLIGVADGEANDFDNVGSVDFFDEGALGAGFSTFNSGVKSTGAAINPGNDSPYIVSTVFDGTNNTLYLNGVAETPVADSNTLDLHTIYVGTRFVSSAVISEYNGSIAEILVYSKELTANEILEINTYLSNKWGITLP